MKAFASSSLVGSENGLRVGVCGGGCQEKSP